MFLKYPQGKNWQRVSPVEPPVGSVERGRQAAALARVVPEGDHRRDIGLHQLAGEAAVISQQGGVGISHVTCRHQSRPVEGKVEVVNPDLPDFIHLKKKGRKKNGKNS